MIPFIGHVGIQDPQGRIFQFVGGGTTMGDESSFLFGKPVRYFEFNYPSSQEALETARTMSEGRIHKGVVDNCHTFVSDFFNNHPEVPGEWNSIWLVIRLMFTGGTYGMNRTLVWLAPSILFWTVLYFLVFRGAKPKSP